MSIRPCYNNKLSEITANYIYKEFLKKFITIQGKIKQDWEWYQIKS